jgi:hypothetical protein
MASKKDAPEITKRKTWDAKPSHKVIHTVVTILITLLLVGGGAYAYYFFTHDTETTITNNPGPELRRTVEALNPSTAKFDEPAFSMTLPTDWKRLPPDLSGPYKKYSYQSNQKNAENRWLYIYVDGLPLTEPVNKAVAVRAEGATLTHGEVSTNCTEFTAEAVPKKLAVVGKWDGVDFLCDMDAKFRNRVGTSSPGNINKVTLTSATSFTPHSFFFIYEDNNFNPEYSIFYDMLDSFTVK